MSIFDKDKKMLTEKRGLGEYELKICMNCKPDGKRNSCGECIHFQEAIDRLAAYEASGLTPKEVAKLKKRFTPELDPKDPDLAKKVEALGEDNGEI